MWESSFIYRYRRWLVLSLFVAGQLAAEAAPAFAALWAYCSPLEWIASLDLVMTGDLDTVKALMENLTRPDTGVTGALLRIVESGVLGFMLVHSVSVVGAVVWRVSRPGWVLFQATFLPIWLALIVYKPLTEHVGRFNSLMEALEALPPDLRKAVGCGVLLLAVAIPLLVVLGAKLLQLLLHPEQAYRPD